MAARRRLRLRQRLPGRPVHAPRLGLLGSVRHEHHLVRAWLGQGLYLVVSDIEAAREELAARGVDVSEVFHAGTPGAQFQPDGSGRVSGPAPDHASYGSFATFSDPDGNGWLLQEITTRLPGRIDAADTAFASAADLASALRRAAAAHGEHEKRTGEARRELARLVRRVHGGGAGRDGAADVSGYDVIVLGGPSE